MIPTNVRSNAALTAVARRLKYRKHRALLCDADRLELTGTYWSGGSRSSYYLVSITREQRVLASPISTPGAPPQHGGGSAPTVEIAPDEFVVELGTFNGKPATMKVYGPTAVETFGEE